MRLHKSQVSLKTKDGLEIRASQQLGEANVLINEIAQINLKLSTASGSQPNNALLDA